MSTRRARCPETIDFQTRDPISGLVPKDMSYTVMRAPLIIDQRLVGREEIRRTGNYCQSVSASRVTTTEISPPELGGTLNIDGVGVVDFHGAIIENAFIDGGVGS